MSNTRTFEVRVEVKKRGRGHFSPHLGIYIESHITKMFHIDARTHEQAIRKAEKYGRPIGVRKASVERMSFNIEKLSLQEPHGIGAAVLTDEFIWQKKNKRAERLENREKDKDDY